MKTDGINFIAHKCQPMIKVQDVKCIKVIEDTIIFKLYENHTEKWFFDSNREAEEIFINIKHVIPGTGV